MTETDIKRRIQLACGGPYNRLWNNPQGQGWIGQTFAVRNNTLISGNARRVHFGLCPGSSDLIGPTSVIVTQEMVGQRVAIFTAVEVKAERGYPTDEQKAFIHTIQTLGGRAGIAKSETDARIIIG